MSDQRGEAPIGDDAREVDDHARGLISDLTDLDVRRRSRDLLNWRILVAFFLLLVAIIIGVTYATQSGDSGDGTATTTSSPDTTTTGADAGADGPLAGTWTMYTTGSDDTERRAFTVRFIGASLGTVEILEDTTEFDTAFALDGDRVSFEFTRRFDLDTGDWAEASAFEGTLVGVDEMSGEYIREDWSCLPDRDPPCAYEPEPLRFPARLVRET